jgi:isopenicillin-N N-acyltransferase-like protein
MDKIRLVELSGTPRQRGQHHGETLRAEIGDLYDTFRGLMAAGTRDTPGFDEATINTYARAHWPIIQRDTPDLAEEIAGIAEGADASLDTVLTLNCVAEIRRLRTARVRQTLIDAGHLAAEGQRGCTCFGVQGGAAADAQVYLGQNYDIEPLWTPIAFRITGHDNTPAQVAIGHAGIICEFGVNDAGIGFVASAIVVADQRPGLPAPVIGRMILSHRTLSEATNALVAAERTIGIHYLIGSRFGLMDVESSAREHTVAYIADDTFAFANHIRSPALQPLGLGIYGHNTFVREGRMAQLLARGHGDISPATLQSYLADHADAPLSICAHVEAGRSTCESRASVVLRPSDGTLWVSDGTPCTHPWREIRAAGEAEAASRLRSIA